MIIVPGRKGRKVG